MAATRLLHTLAPRVVDNPHQLVLVDRLEALSVDFRNCLILATYI